MRREGGERRGKRVLYVSSFDLSKVFLPLLSPADVSTWLHINQLPQRDSVTGKRSLAKVWVNGLPS